MRNRTWPGCVAWLLVVAVVALAAAEWVGR